MNYDAENRLVSVSGAATATFSYNPDHQRVLAIVNGTWTAFVGSYFEKDNTGVSTKYYMAGATCLAMRKGGTLNYILSDHLGSSGLTTDANGGVTSELRYKAFGKSRFTDGTMPTRYQFTGQYVEPSLGIYYFNARWFDPTLGRFTSPDTLVPTSTQGTQAWDRYAFVNNNPVRYTDPTGHVIDQGDGGRCTTDIDCSSKSTEKKIESYLANDQLDKAVQLAIIRWHIELQGASVSYNPYLNGYGRTPDRWHIEIGSKTTSAGLLASALYHESVHVEQFRSGTNYAGSYLTDEGPQMNEYEAYKKEETWAHDNKIPLTPEQKKEITDSMEDMKELLLPENLALANQGIFLIKPSTIDYPNYIY